MPVTGLPLMLENMINGILQESQLTSYKIAGGLDRTTLVLRFDNKMADSTDNSHMLSKPLSTLPANSSFRKKSPSQIRRDRSRIQNHHKSSHGLSQTKPTILDCKTITDGFVIDSTPPDDPSPSHPKQCATARQDAIFYSTRRDEQNFGEQEESRKRTESETESESYDVTAKSTSIQGLNDHSFIVDCDREGDVTETQNEDMNNTSKSSVSATLNNTVSSNENTDDIKLYEWVYDQINDIERKTATKITQRERNNAITKLALDTIAPTKELILAEMDDMIVEYSINTGHISSIVFQDLDYENWYSRRRRKSQITQWPDRTELLQGEKYKHHFDYLQSILPRLKYLIKNLKLQ